MPACLSPARARLPPLQEGESRRGGKKNGVRILRSGAASLPHADALRLKKIFGGRTCVMPTYSMTECMPVSRKE